MACSFTFPWSTPCFRPVHRSLRSRSALGFGTYLRPHIFVSIETVRKTPDIGNSLETGDSLFIDRFERQGVGSARSQCHVELPIMILRRETEVQPVGSCGKADFLLDDVPDAGTSLGIPPAILKIGRECFFLPVDLPHHWPAGALAHHQGHSPFFSLSRRPLP